MWWVWLANSIITTNPPSLLCTRTHQTQFSLSLSLTQPYITPPIGCGIKIFIYIRLRTPKWSTTGWIKSYLKSVKKPNSPSNTKSWALLGEKSPPKIFPILEYTFRKNKVKETLVQAILWWRDKERYIHLSF